MRSRERHEPIDGAVGSPVSVGPFDTDYSGAGFKYLDRDDVAFRAAVEVGVRVNLELRVAGDGDVYVEGFRVTHIDDLGHAAVHAGSDGEKVNLPVGDASSILPALSEDAERFIGAGDDDSRNDSDDDASPEAHETERIEDDPWGTYTSRILKLPTGKRVALILTAVAA